MARFRINLTVFKKFVASSSFSGVLLLCCVVVSIGLGNSSFANQFASILEHPVGFSLPHMKFHLSVASWINDGLMAVFFLLVGLEIKRELVEGELASLKRAILPVVAAFGGALLPALIYTLFNRNHDSTMSGWGIPMATDIAFAIGVLSLLGKRVPPSLKVFLAALAIVDDLIAILVIALFYSSEIHLAYLLAGLFIVGVMLLLNLLKVKSLWPYLLLGAVLWMLVHHSGIHATIAGVLTALNIPTNKGNELSPLERLEHFLANPVHFVIMPIFALANTNIRFEPGILSSLASRMSLGIMIGLLVGKVLGITISSWLVVKLNWGKLPRGARWREMVGVGLLGGIGFTMSIFIALLSFSDIRVQADAKFAILLGSVVSGIAGCLYLLIVTRKKNKRLAISKDSGLIEIQ